MPEGFGGLSSVGSDAQMVMLSETLNTTRDANAEAMNASPVVRATKWEAEPNSCEECQNLAAADSGLGPGFYAPDEWPDAPHPNCLCQPGDVLLGDEVEAEVVAEVEFGLEPDQLDELPTLEQGLHGGELPDPDVRGDKMLAAIADDRGFSALPELAGESRIDDLVREGWRELYRGVTHQEYADAFRTGAHFAGNPGGSGIGTYVAEAIGGNSQAASAYAKFYSTKKGEVMRMVLKPDTRVTTMEALKVEQKAFLERLNKVRDATTDPAQETVLTKMWFALNDPGRFAAYRGWDAYEGFEASVGYQEMVVLNRSALVVQQ